MSWAPKLLLNSILTRVTSHNQAPRAQTPFSALFQLCSNIYSQTRLSTMCLNPRLLGFLLSSLRSVVVETIIFVRYASNSWNVFNSSLIPPTQLYHAKRVPCTCSELRNTWLLKSSMILQNPTYSFSLHYNATRL